MKHWLQNEFVSNFCLCFIRTYVDDKVIKMYICVSIVYFPPSSFHSIKQSDEYSGREEIISNDGK